MIDIRIASEADLSAIVPQERQRAERATAAALSMGPSFTIEADERILFVGGFCENHPGWASLWSLFAADLGKHYFAIVRAIRGAIEAAHYRRIDTLVDASWPRAHALANLLGFAPEGIIGAAGPNGEDLMMFARIRAGEA